MRILPPLCGLLLLACAAVTLAQDLVLPAGQGRVDWSTGEVRASAVEAVDPDPFAPTGDPAVALRKAAMTARRGLLQAVTGLRLNAEWTAADLMARDPSLAGRVRAYLQSTPFSQEEKTLDSGGRSLEVTAAAQLSGTLADMLLPASRIQFQSGVPPRRTPGAVQPFTPGAPSLEPAEAPAAPILPLPKLPASAAYTGLVVDARDLPVVPALLPVLYDESGTGLYGAFLVSRDAALANRLTVYAASPEAPALKDRVGDNPLTVKARRLADPAGTDLILSAADAAQVRALFQNTALLSRCAVAILTPPGLPPAGSAPEESNATGPGPDAPTPTAPVNP